MSSLVEVMITAMVRTYAGEWFGGYFAPLRNDFLARRVRGLRSGIGLCFEGAAHSKHGAFCSLSLPLSLSLSIPTTQYPSITYKK